MSCWSLMSDNIMSKILYNPVYCYLHYRVCSYFLFLPYHNALNLNWRTNIENKCIVKFSDAARAYNTEGVEFIFEHFDTYFSIIVHGNKLEWNVINKGTYKKFVWRIWSTIFKTSLIPIICHFYFSFSLQHLIIYLALSRIYAITCSNCSRIRTLILRCESKTWTWSKWLCICTIRSWKSRMLN